MGLSEGELLRQMPPRLAEIARLIGVRPAIALSCHFGGSYVYIPGTLTETCSLVKAVGMGPATVLADFFGRGFSQNILVPVFFKTSMASRLQGIRLLKEGNSIGEVARQVGVARNTVSSWKRTYLEEAA